ncbi:MAG: hypothetical protein JXR64_01935 [Spirochaetales bacterium]|nr:hypothetical protein [Spirochaetales bacterium]
MYIKNKGVFNFIQILSLLILSFIVFIVIKPSIEKLQTEIFNKRETIIKEFEYKTGLKISYSSMSPLIVDSIKLNNLKLSSPSGINSLDIGNVTIKFNIINIILSSWKKIDPPQFLTYVTLSNGSIHLDVDDPWLLNLFSGSGNSISIIKTTLYAKDIDVYINNEVMGLEVNKLNGSITGRYNRYTSKLKAKVTYNSKIELPFKYITADIEASGNLSHNFSKINSIVKSKNTVSDIGTVKDLDTNIIINKDEVSIRNRDKSNLDYLFTIKINLMENYYWLKGKNIDIKDIFIPNSNFTKLDSYLGSKFTGEFSGVHDINNNFFDYSIKGNGDIKIDQEWFSGNIYAVGDLNYLRVKKLNVSTKYGYIGFYGGIDLKKLFPQGRFYVRDLNINNINFDADFYTKIIDDNFVSLNFDYLKTGDLNISDIKALFFIDESSISLKALKNDKNGRISLSSKLNLESKNLSANIKVTDLNTNILNTFSQVELLTPYISGGDISCDIDFNYIEGISNYFINDFVLKDVNKNIIGELEGHGTDYNFEIDQLKITLPDIEIQSQISGNIGTEESKFTVDALFNDNKYKLNVQYSDNKITCTGSYGIDGTYIFDGSYYITLRAKDLPINYKEYSLLSTIEFKGLYQEKNSFIFSIPNLNLELTGANLPFSPKLSAVINGSNSNIEISNLILEDNIAPLNGKIEIALKGDNGYAAKGFFENKSEKANLLANISNDFKNYDITVGLEKIILERLNITGLKGVADANFQFKGSLEEFNGTGSFIANQVQYNRSLVDLNLNAKLNENLITITNVKAIIDNNIIDLPLVTYNYKNGDIIGKIESNINVGENRVITNLTLETNIQPAENILLINNDLLSLFNGKINILSMKSNDKTFFQNKAFRFFKNRNALQVYSLDKNLKLFYSYTTGVVNGKIVKPYFMESIITGEILNNKLDLSISNINIDGSFINDFIPMDNTAQKPVNIKQLELHGDIKISGDMDKPVINGLLWLDTNVTINYFKDEVKPTRINIRVTDNKFTVLNNNILVGDRGKIDVSGEIIFESWNIDSILLNLEIPYSGKIPIIYYYDRIVIDTSIYSSKLQFYWDNSGSLITGDLIIEEGEFYTQLNSVKNSINNQNKSAKNDSAGVELDMLLKFGPSNKLYWPTKSFPVVNATLNPGDQISVKYKSITDEFFVNGQLSIVSGEVDYSGKPFILKEGIVKLDISKDNIDPQISILGSKTVIDDDDRQVEVYISYDGGLFSDFKPKFSSSDATKTEEDISRLIGLAFTGDDLGLLAFDIIDELATSYLTAPFEEGLERAIGIDDVKIKSGFISNLLTNITNNSFDTGDESIYNLSEILKDSSITFGDFITDDFFIKSSVASIFENKELGVEVNLGFTLYSPHFQLGFNFIPKLNNEYVFEPELGLSLEWIYSPK